MTKLKIKVTKEILEKSKMCSNITAIAIHNCAIALAVRDIFPRAKVWWDHITALSYAFKIDLPPEAITFIELFDETPFEERPSLQPIEFEIEIPDEVLERISIDEIKPLLVNHPTLELV